MRCRIVEDEHAASAVAKLETVLAEHVPDEEERRFVEPRVAHLLGLEEGSRYERDDLFAAWRVFFERLADVNPVALVFEDMQWADDSLLDFIDYLLEFTRSSPLFVVMLARPELQDKRPTWGAGRRNFTSLYLEPLSGKAMEELLSGLVPGLPDEVRAQILERAEGIPLYAVETVRMLLDRGALALDGPVYRPTGPIDSLDVPETLQALIAARLDGLAPDERRLLQDASVLGKTFTKPALAALSGVSEAELDQLLGSLVRKEVLGVQADPRSPEHGQHSFLQDLVRHVAYETVSKKERRTKHLPRPRASGGHVPGGGRDRRGAGRPLPRRVQRRPGCGRRPRDRGQGARDARPRGRSCGLAGGCARGAALLRAGGGAHERPANARGSPSAGGPDGLAAGKGRGGASVVRAGLVRVRGGRLTHHAARVSARLAEIDFREGHSADAVARLETAIQALAADEPDEDVAAVEGQLGRFLVLNGQIQEAAPHLERALELSEALGLPEVLVESLTSKGALFLRVDRLNEARILLEGSLAHAIAHDLSASTLRASNNLAVVFESSDRYMDAVEITERALQLARRLGDRNWEVQMLTGPISSLIPLGRWDQAAAQAAEAESLPGAEHVQNLIVYLVAVDCWRGTPAEARAHLTRFRPLQELDDVQSWGSYALHEAMVLRAEGKPRAALDALEPVLAHREELGITYLLIKRSLIEAMEAAFALGDTVKLEEILASVEALRPGERPPMVAAHAARFRALSAQLSEEAETGFGQAAKLFRELGMPFWLAVAQAEHAEWLIQHNRAPEAEPLLTDARGAFERLEAQPWLERLAALDRPVAEAQV